MRPHLRSVSAPKEIHFKTEEALKKHIMSGESTLYVSSQTSTVIPYSQLEKTWTLGQIGHLGQLPKKIELLADGTLRIRGAVSWKEAREFAEAHGRMILTSPTEELALMLAGIATSCTGERCFAFGNLRSQVSRILYLDHRGQERELLATRPLRVEGHELTAYAGAFESFREFKNAPFPRLETETDLMTGTEGQLGVVIEADFQTRPKSELIYAFLLLPRWEESIEAHLEVHAALQSWRGKVLACELVDSNGMNFVPPELRLGQGRDVVFLEVLASEFEKLYTDVLSRLQFVPVDFIFEISEAKYSAVRKAVPRGLFEANSRAGVTKQGTDVQVAPHQLELLLKKYREAALLGVPYTLFGHFGDAHLHFNFNLTSEQRETCESYFKALYDSCYEWKGSPFAEHGIGLLKQPYIRRFHSQEHLATFTALKRQHDPLNQFFPGGFMSPRSG